MNKKELSAEPVAWKEWYDKGFEAGQVIGAVFSPDSVAEIAHWKANHDNRVEAARILIERTDVPFERVQAYKRHIELQAENERLTQQVAELRKAKSICQRIVEELPKTMGMLNKKMLLADIQEVYDLVNKEQVTKVTKLTAAMELAEEALDLNLVFMDTPVLERKVQPYTQTYDALAAIKEAKGE